ncbi:MAG: hypothetical protein V4484_10945 [Pseudomonadota bacterium]
MNQKLSPIRTAFLKLIMASYGPWYLLRGPFGNWYTCSHYDAENEQAMESYLIDDDDDDVDESYCFTTRRAALKEILKTLDSEIDDGGGAGYVAARQRARDSLIAPTDEQDPVAAQNDFSGTADETQLVEAWIRLDQYEAHAKVTAAKRRATYVAACAEQERRERVFEQVAFAFGDQVIEEINAAIANAWLAGGPKTTRTAHGLKEGDAVPMPQLAIVSGRAVFCISGRVKHLPVKTPLSKRDTSKGYVNYWKHSTWLDFVVPAIAQIIDRHEQEAQTVTSHGSGARLWSSGTGQ